MIELPPLEAIDRVTFFSRDKVTTDLICCEIESLNGTFFLHEEAVEWQPTIAHLSALIGFRVDWFSHVSRPPFEPCTFVAFEKVLT